MFILNGIVGCCRFLGTSSTAVLCMFLRGESACCSVRFGGGSGETLRLVSIRLLSHAVKTYQSFSRLMGDCLMGVHHSMKADNRAKGTTVMLVRPIFCFARGDTTESN